MIGAAFLLGMAQAATFDSSSTVTRMIAGGFGHCVARKKPDLARKAILDDWTGRQMHEQGLILPECLMAGSLAIRALPLKASMATTLLDRDATDASAERIKSAPPLTYRQPAPPITVDRRGKPLSKKLLEQAQKGFQSDVEAIAIAQFGECVVRQNPAAVPALAKSVLNSKTETAAFKPFGPHLGGCLPTGMTMELDKPTLRAVLTLAYYRLAMAATAGASN